MKTSIKMCIVAVIVFAATALLGIPAVALAGSAGSMGISVAPGIVGLILAIVALSIPFILSGAALTAAKQTNLQGEPKLQHFDVKAAAKIFKGGIVCVDATGFAIPGADTAGNITVGIAVETVDNTSGASGAKKVEVAFDCVARLVGASLVQTSVGSNVFVTDDSSVDETTTNSIKVGKLMVFISATEGLVFIPGLTDKV